MKLSLGAVAIALACVSCADEAPLHVTVYGGTVEQRAEVERAPDAWNVVARRGFVIVASGGDLSIRIVPLPEPYDGFSDRRLHVIDLRDGLEGPRLRMVARHELGHALGLDDINEPGVMNVHAGQLDLSQGDIAECERVGAC
jgi:hypothetical protein